MDIVDCFRQEHNCGAIVHARIQREKALHSKGKLGTSKGWALLQFEERESVEKALELDEKLELHGNSLRVERSHIAAVGIVPPGMHRHVPKTTQEGGDDKKDSHRAKSTTAPTGSVGILAFRPRGVAKNKNHPRVRVKDIGK